jgi:hypothetical protein
MLGGRNKSQELERSSLGGPLAKGEVDGLVLSDAQSYLDKLAEVSGSFPTGGYQGARDSDVRVEAIWDLSRDLRAALVAARVHSPGEFNSGINSLEPRLEALIGQARAVLERVEEASRLMPQDYPEDRVDDSWVEEYRLLVTAVLEEVRFEYSILQREWVNGWEEKVSNTDITLYTIRQDRIIECKQKLDWQTIALEAGQARLERTYQSLLSYESEPIRQFEKVVDGSQKLDLSLIKPGMTIKDWVNSQTRERFQSEIQAKLEELLGYVSGAREAVKRSLQIRAELQSLLESELERDELESMMESDDEQPLGV